MKKEALIYAIRIAGSHSKLAEIINQVSKGSKVTKSNIGKWVSLGKVPSLWVLSVELATGVPCWELRPDLYPPNRFSCIKKIECSRCQ